MDFHSKRDESEDSLPPQRKKPRLGDLDANPAKDQLDQQLWSEARIDPETCGMLVPTLPMAK